jgi:hypothetical protein
MLGILFLTFFQIQFKEDHLFYKKNELSDNLHSALTLIAAEPSLIPVGDEKRIDVFADSSAFVDFAVERWGMLRKVTAVCQWRSLVLKRIVLMGEKEENRPVLWMPDNKSFISLVGKSYINGDCYLPEQGIRKGNAEGRYFEGPFLHKGKLYRSDEQLPSLKNELVQYINSYLEGEKNKSDSLFLWNNINAKSEKYNSFKDKTLYIQSSEKLILDRGKFTGNIIFYSPDTIEIWPSVSLKDVMLFGKTIIFKEEFKGQLQAFAKNNVIIGKNCELTYPSFLGCLNDKSGFNILIEEGSLINGGIIGDSKSRGQENSLLWQKKRSKIIGKAYINGDCRLHGDIIGTLYCNRFILRTSRAFYENFLIDCTIDEVKLSKDFVSFCINDNVQALEIIKECH